MTDDYRGSLQAELETLKAAAASRRTYGDDFELEDRLRETIDWIRGAIRDSANEVRRSERRAVRLRFSDWATRELADDRAVLAMERAHRDELVAGLHEMKRQDRQEAREFQEYLRARGRA